MADASQAARVPRIRDVDWADRAIIRAGVMPRATVGGVTFYALALQSGVGDLTDFGGRRDPYDRDALDTALREFREESLGVFGDLTRPQALGLPAIRSKSLACVILPLAPHCGAGCGRGCTPIPPLAAYGAAHSAASRGIRGVPEVASVIWVTRRQLLNAVAEAGRPAPPDSEGIPPVIYPPFRDLLAANLEVL